MEKISLKTLLDQKLLDISTPFLTFNVLETDWRRCTYGGVYVFKGEDDQVLYVGISDTLSRRIRHHLRGGGCPDLYAYDKEKLTVSVLREDNPLYRDIYESYLIHTLDPRYNVGKTDKQKLNLEEEVA